MTGNVQVHFRNKGERPFTVAVEDNAYKTATVTRTVAAGHEESIVLNLKQSYGWYDFTVKTGGSGPKPALRARGNWQSQH
jgi:phospholipase C